VRRGYHPPRIKQVIVEAGYEVRELKVGGAL